MSWDSGFSVDFGKLKLSSESSESAPLRAVDPLFTKPAPLLFRSDSGLDIYDDYEESDGGSDIDDEDPNPIFGVDFDYGLDSDSDLEEISVEKPPSDKQGFVPEEATSYGDLGPQPPKECKICGGGHWTSICSCWTEIPEGGKVNEDDYIIICYCGMTLDNGSCTRPGCCASSLPRRVVSRADIDFLDARYKQET